MQEDQVLKEPTIYKKAVGVIVETGAISDVQQE